MTFLLIFPVLKKYFANVSWKLPLFIHCHFTYVITG